MKEGERLRAKLELSRTYFEIGKRFGEKRSEYKELNGIKAEGYLENAKIIFEELDLMSDLEEMGRLRA